MKAYKFKGRSTDGDIVKYIVGIHDNVIIEIYRTLLLNDASFVPEYIKQGWKVVKTYKGKTLLKSMTGFNLENFIQVAKIVELLMMDNLRESK